MNADAVDPIVDQLPSWAPPERRRRRWPRRVAIATVLLLVLTLVPVGFGAQQTLAFAEAHEDRLLPGITVAGVDIGGMTADEALETVRATTESDLDREISLSWGDKTWTTTPRDLGSRSDAEAAVAAAVDASGTATWTDLWRMRWRGEGFGFDRDVTITHDREQIRAFVLGIVPEVNRDPVDAAIDHSSGWVEFTSDEVGYRTDVALAYTDLTRAVTEGGSELDLPVQTVQPDVTADAFSQVLLLRQNEFRLYLYEDGEITHDWAVAIGESGYPTPTGTYEVTLKRFMPTWVNPAPNGWGSGMPARIGPGPSNPLGVRALNWSPEAGAIRFHGTAATHSIGTAASKGCVRLTNSDVVNLYDLVEVGATIISLRA
jgi:hypothetical protein